MARTHFSLHPGQARPTMTFRMPGPEREEAAWLQCLPRPWNVQSIVGNVAPWGPGPAPVVSIVGSGPVPDWGFGGVAVAAKDEARCAGAIDQVANSISRAYESIKHSRLDNYNIGPRGGFPTVTIKAPQGSQATCIRVGVFSGGNIPGVWPKKTHPMTTKVTALTTATPPPRSVFTTVTVYATRTASAATSHATNYPGPHLPREVEVETSQIEQVPCRPFADVLISDWTQVITLEKGTKLTVNCWYVDLQITKTKSLTCL
jgi:hypothetical protein